MVDTWTYSKMHRVSRHRSDLKAPVRLDQFDQWPQSISRQEALDDKSILLLPPTVFGFDFQEKKWGKYIALRSKAK
jgi:hypothetical protein